jgi:glyoxylase-like metal-dependent hydrolase (beta-lactamase superfamily II)
VRLIDVEHQGIPHVIGAWLVDGVLIDPGPASTVPTLLRKLDGEVPRVIAATHIHLDHSGAVGTLVREWPGVEVWVHQRGAPHLAEPEKLLRSAARLYGEDMDRLWGETLPVPRERLSVLGEGGVVDGFRYAYTPGHASHHVAFLHEATGTAFTGDAGGVRIGDGPVSAPTPPPDVDLEAWRRSLEVIEAWRPTALVPTHFGRHEGVAEHLDELRAYLDEWGTKARELDRDAWIAAYRARIAPAAEVPAIEQAMPVEQQYAGLERYWSKRS